MTTCTPEIFTANEIGQLQGYADSGNLNGYCGMLESKGYQYGTLAKGVVNDNTVFGQTANNYAQAVAAETGVTLDIQSLIENLMKLDA